MRRLLLLAIWFGCAGVFAADFAERYPPGSITTRAQADQAIAAAEQEQARQKQVFDQRDQDC